MASIDSMKELIGSEVVLYERGKVDCSWKNIYSTSIVTVDGKLIMLNEGTRQYVAVETTLCRNRNLCDTFTAYYILGLDSEIEIKEEKNTRFGGKRVSILVPKDSYIRQDEHGKRV